MTLSDLPRLPRFAKKLAFYADEVSPATFYRWFRGELPSFGDFLVAHPDVLEALLHDARELHKEQQTRDHRAERIAI